MGLLKCSKCGESKSPESFYVRSDRPRGRSSKCKTCTGNSSKQVREWREANPEKNSANRKRERVKIYDLDVEAYDAMLEEQGHRCAICLTGTPGGRGSWHIDHQHGTTNVRGLLCNRCNQGLGYFRDNRANLERANAYLEVRNLA
jgi:hypothetical protein